MLAPALGESRLSMQSSEKCVYGFAAKDAENRKVDVYLLNKQPQSVRIRLDVGPGFDGAKTATESFVSPGKISTADVGRIAGGFVTVGVEAFSFDRITVHR